MEAANFGKMKILCLHGFRTSGSYLKMQISQWDPSIFAHFDLDFPDGIYPAGGKSGIEGNLTQTDFPDGIYPAGGKSGIEGIFPPPYFEWFQFSKDFTGQTNLEACIDYLCNYITTNGPFHGLLGFSQGAALSALLLGYQAQGKILKQHPPINLFVSISGSKFKDPAISAIAYKELIKVRSIHFVGEKDWQKVASEEMAAAFERPLIIRHPQGHTVPRLDEEAVEKVCGWIRHGVVLQRSINAEMIKHQNTKQYAKGTKLIKEKL